jgi:hypothetical protein
MQRVVAARISDYLESSSLRAGDGRNNRSPVAASIVQFIRCQDPAGRFLKKDPGAAEDGGGGGAWYDIGDVKAIEKVGHALYRTAQQNQNAEEKETRAATKRAAHEGAASGNNQLHGELLPLSQKEVRESVLVVPSPFASSPPARHPSSRKEPAAAIQPTSRPLSKQPCGMGPPVYEPNQHDVLCSNHTRVDSNHAGNAQFRVVVRAPSQVRIFVIAGMEKGHCCASNCTNHSKPATGRTFFEARSSGHGW